MTQILPDSATLDSHASTEPEFARWRGGYGVIVHDLATQAAVYRMAHQLVQMGLQADLASAYRLFTALDRLSSAALWLVVHKIGRAHV